MQVDEVKSDEVICTSRNSAQLDGLLTVFHTERSADSLQNIQNDLPILTEYDKKIIAAISKEIEIDFLSLSFVREGEDLTIAREYLESIGATTTKVCCHPAIHSTPLHSKKAAEAQTGSIHVRVQRWSSIARHRNRDLRVSERDQSGLMSMLLVG